MTKEIDRREMGREHSTKQPPGKPYALFCKPVRAGEYGIACQSEETGGHLGDFRTAEEAEGVGIEHPHPVILAHFPGVIGDTPES